MTIFSSNLLFTVLTLYSDFGPDESIIDLEQPSRPEQTHTDVPAQAPRETSPASDACSAADADESNYHAIQAKSIIQLELDDSRFITIGRTSILRSALQLVSDIAEKERHQSALFAEGEPPVEPDVTVPDSPPREMLFMLLRGTETCFSHSNTQLTKHRTF